MSKQQYNGHWKIATRLPNPRCGGSWRYKNYTNFLHNLVKEIKAKNILEIGFNNGHSACNALNASPKAKLVSFDIGKFGYEEEAYLAIKENFDIELIIGDSIETVPKYLEENPEILYDYIFVDGDHRRDHPYLDIVNTAFRLSSGGLLLIDDWNLDPVRKGANKFIEENGEEFIMHDPLDKRWRNRHPDHPASKAHPKGKIEKKFKIIARR